MRTHLYTSGKLKSMRNYAFTLGLHAVTKIVHTHLIDKIFWFQYFCIMQMEWYFSLIVVKALKKSLIEPHFVTVLLTASL